MKYIVLESFKYKGVKYTEGSTIELDENEAAAFANRFIKSVEVQNKKTKDTVVKKVK